MLWVELRHHKDTFGVERLRERALDREVVDSLGKHDDGAPTTVQGGEVRFGVDTLGIARDDGEASARDLVPHTRQPL